MTWHDNLTELVQVKKAPVLWSVSIWQPPVMMRKMWIPQLWLTDFCSRFHGRR